MTKFDRFHDLFCRPTVVVPVTFFLLIVFVFIQISLKKYYTKELKEDDPNSTSSKEFILKYK